MGRIRSLALRAPKSYEHTKLVAWRNANRHKFLHPKPITLDSHLAWYSTKRKSFRDHFFVVAQRSSGVMIGTIGFTSFENVGEYNRFLIAEPYRGRGFGKEALWTLLDRGFYEGIDKFYGLVIATNGEAIALNRQLGFKESTEKRTKYDKIPYLVDVIKFTMKAEDLPSWENLSWSQELDIVEQPGSPRL